MARGLCLGANDFWSNANISFRGCSFGRGAYLGRDLLFGSYVCVRTVWFGLLYQCALAIRQHRDYLVLCQLESASVWLQTSGAYLEFEFNSARKLKSTWRPLALVGTSINTDAAVAARIFDVDYQNPALNGR
jgi:hypothetical protein